MTPDSGAAPGASGRDVAGQPAGRSPDPDRPRRTGWRTWLRAGLLLAMFGFAGYALAANWASISQASARLSGWAVLASVPPVVLATGAALGVWWSLMSDLGAELPVRVAARTFYLSQLGKYVPGSVWSVVTQMELSRDHGVPRRTVVAVGGLALAVSACVGIPLAAVTLPLAAPDAARRYWWALLLLPLLLVALHPRVLGRALDLVLRLLRRPPLPRPPSWRGLRRAAGWQLLVWLLLGLHAWLLLVGIGAPAGRALPVAVGGYALAYSLGLLAVVLPAGVGVRDVALVVACGAVVPGPAAVVVALVSRGVLTVVDVVLATLWSAHRPRR